MEIDYVNDFCQYLKKNSFITEDKHKYYIMWVNRFLNAAKNHNNFIEDLHNFLSSLYNPLDPTISNWKA